MRRTPDLEVRVRALAGPLCCVLGKDTLLSQCLSTPRSINGYHQTVPIVQKRVSSYSTRARDSLLVPRFSSRYMKDSVAYRGSILWNTVTNKHNDLVKTRYSDLRWKLKSLAIYNDFNFKVTSPSTCSFRFEEFLYT